MIMGTYITISVEKQDIKELENGFEIFKTVDQSLSSYKETSPIFKLNKNKKANINTITYEALKRSKKYYNDTNGYFDISVGSITKDIYHFGEKQEHLATKNQLQNATINLSGLTFTKDSASLEPHISIDLGGMGKGFAVDKVIEEFKKKNLKNTRVAASGDIRSLGNCEILVENPFSQEPLAKFRTRHYETAVSTSGNYNRYILSEKNNHLINPKQKAPQEGFVSITLISKLPNSDLDAYATAASVMPLQKSLEFLQSLELGYILLTTEKMIFVSKNISEYVKDLELYQNFLSQP